ncbi:hypothetical protein sos41_28770 [Alphaproteobacteria bacterium SO-S41]|nr:hypothetical protein sos41_28770 [Alphaproteobacteria bacterium SO-S41]
MFEKNLDVVIDEATWPTKAAPAFIRSGAGQQLIDIPAALLLLGSVTTPAAGSLSSPARFWAWVRYFVALHTTRDFRITMPFSDLDPHQKGILSDDFGVAMSTQWLSDRLGGFVDLVDGRKFMLQFAGMMRRMPRGARKVGPSKAPDYVALDSNGRWHVLECKGTQSGRSARNGFLQRAIQQKSVIDIVGRMRGQRLGAGLAISHENDRRRSQLRIVDPDPDEEPLLKLDGRAQDDTVKYARRLSVARSLGVIGFSRLATELALPSEEDLKQGLGVVDLLLPSERAALRIDTKYRSSRAKDQLDEVPLRQFELNGEIFLGKITTLKVPELREVYGVSSIKIRQGVKRELVRELRSDDNLARKRVEDKIDAYVKSDGLVTSKGVRSRSISYGGVFRSDIAFE